MQADAFDSQDRAGTPRARTVILNRRVPVAPEDFGGGRNGSSGFVDLQWVQNPECDVKGYRVYRSSTDGVLGSAITCIGETTDITEGIKCLDDPPAGWQFYTVVALDLPTGSSTPREGNPSTQIAVGDPSGRPPEPTGVSLCVGDGSTACVDAGGDAAPVGHGRGELEPVDRSGRNPVLPDLPRRHGVREPLRRLLPQRIRPGLRLVRVRLVGRAAHLHVSAVDRTFTESVLSAG